MRDAIADLGPVEDEEQQAVIEEFFRIGPLVPERTLPGIELDAPVARRIQPNIARPQLSERTQPATHPAAPPFQFLDEANTVSLARFLEREHPQTVAVVVSHLPREQAAEVLSLLPATLQGDVMLRLAQLDETDPEILAEIERGIYSWFRQQLPTARPRAAGMETLRKILAAADERSKGTILRNLAHRDRNLAGRLSESPAARRMTFADVEQLDERMLAAVLRQAGFEVLELALAGAGNEFFRRALSVLPVYEARRLQENLDRLGPTRLSDVEQAQQELAAIAERLQRAQPRGREDTGRLSVAV